MSESKKKSKFARYWFYDFVLFTAAVPGLIAYRPRILYESKEARKRIKGGALLIGNHNGFFDPIYLMFCIYYRRQRFVCTKEFFEGRKAKFFKAVQCIAIDRDNFGLDSFREIVDTLKMGEVVSIFPEGRIVSEGAATFKSGMILMAMQSDCPIIPIYARKRKSYWERLTMAVGEPVYVNQPGKRASMSDIQGITELLQDKEDKLRTLVEERRK